MVSSFLLLHMIDLVKQNNIYNKTSYLKFVGMEVLDGIVKHTVQQDTMVIYVRRHVSVWIICVINKQGVRHDRVRHVSSTLIKCELTYFFFRMSTWWTKNKIRFKIRSQSTVWCLNVWNIVFSNKLNQQLHTDYFVNNCLWRNCKSGRILR